MSRVQWEQLKNWRPFSIDALGLVTLLGADEVDQALGTLSRRRFTECLPLLASFIIAQDRFVREQAGYALYNITDGITTTELKGWFTRWLSAQTTLKATTIFRWEINEKPRRIGLIDLVAPLLAILAVAPLLICTIWIEDWCGVANTVAIIASILVRCFILWQRRRAIDIAVAREQAKLPPTKEPELLPLSEKRPSLPDDDAESIAQLHRRESAPTAMEVVKMLVTRADGKMITIYAPRPIQNLFVRDAKLQQPAAYQLARYVGWGAFGTQMCILGMCSLFAQIYIVALLVLSTWLLCCSFSPDTGTTKCTGIALDGTESKFFKTNFGTKLQVIQEDPRAHEVEVNDRRMHAFARLQATERQEMMLKHWSMLPFPGGTWYDNYHKARAGYKNKTDIVKQGSTLSKSPSVQSQPDVTD